MGTSYHLRKGLVASFFCFGALSAQAKEPTFTKHNVNGYDVYIINTHIGNSVAVTVNVQTGSVHDEPTKLAGRAHLWEHWIHGGSKKYPGHTTFFDTIGSVGGNYNAYTSDNRTFYHWMGHHHGMKEVTDYLGAMLTEPEWNFETLRNELETVKEEAAQYQSSDDRALSSVMNIHLTPKNHPFQMFDVGTQKQLDEMNPHSLKALFYSNYRPGSMQIILAANLDPQEDGKPVSTQDELLSTVAQNFPPFSVPDDPELKPLMTAPSKTIVFPSIIAHPGHLHYVELGTPTENRSLEFVFEAPSRVDPANLSILIAYLGLRNEGSLYRQLSQKNWISDFGVYASRLNNLDLVRGGFTLTEEGSAHRNEIISALLTAIQEIQKRGIRPDVLKQLVQRQILRHEDSMRSPDDAAEYFATFLDFDEFSPELAFKSRERFQQVTSDGVRYAARASFDVGRMHVGYLGNDVQSSTMEPTFNRPMRIITDESIMKSWQDAITNGGVIGKTYDQVQTSKFKFKFSDKPIDARKQPPRLIESGYPGVIAALRESHDSPLGALSIELKLPPSSVVDSVALSLLSAAFSVRYKTEEFYFSSMATPVHQEADHLSYVFQSWGNSGAIPELLTWTMGAFSTFVPTNEELNVVREMAISKLIQSMDTMPGHTVRSSALPFMKGPQYFHRSEILEALRTIDLSEVVQRARARLQAVDISILAAGDFLQEHVDAMVHLAKEHFPKQLSDEQRLAHLETFPQQKENIAFWTPLAENKDETMYGWARTYGGPPVFSREHAAFKILDQLLGSAVMSHNRIKQNLGYIHNAYHIASRTGIRPILFGQTDGLGNLEKMQEGWDYVLGKILDGTLSDDDFRAARQAAIRDEGLLPFHPREDLSELMKNLNYTNDPEASEKWKAYLADVTPAEIYAVGRKVFQGTPTFDVFTSRTKPAILGCEHAMDVPAAVRSALSKP